MLGLLPLGLGGALPVLPGAQPGMVSLLIGGMIYEGWEEVEVRLSKRKTAGEFTLHVSEASAGSTPSFMTWRIRPQDPCQIFYGGILVLTGYVDAYNPRYSKEHHAVTIQGRSKTADLVDSSVDDEIPGGEQRDVTIDQVARTAVKKFGIGVKVEGDVGPKIDVARVRPGESVHRFLERYARQAGVMLSPDRMGNLKLSQVEDGGAVARLIEGVNILEASAMLRGDKRHSKTTVKGQNSGTDQKHGRDASRVKAEAKDGGVKRHRPLVMLDENKTSRKNARRRAAWESAVRAGETTRAEIKVVDWCHAPGQLWEPGQRVGVSSPMLALDRTLVLESLVLTQSRGRGTIASLSLVPPEATNPKPGKKGKGGGAGAGAGNGSGPAAGSFRAGQEEGMGTYTGRAAEGSFRAGQEVGVSDRSWTDVKPTVEPQ